MAQKEYRIMDDSGTILSEHSSMQGAKMRMFRIKKGRCVTCGKWDCEHHNVVVPNGKVCIVPIVECVE